MCCNVLLRNTSVSIIANAGLPLSKKCIYSMHCCQNYSQGKLAVETLFILVIIMETNKCRYKLFKILIHIIYNFNDHNDTEESDRLYSSHLHHLTYWWVFKKLSD